MPSRRQPPRRRAWIVRAAIWTAVFGVLSYGTFTFVFLSHKGPSTRSIAQAPMPYVRGVLAFEHARSRLPVLRSADWPAPLRGPRVGGSGTVPDVPALLLRGSRVVQWGDLSTAPVNLAVRHATVRRGRRLLVYVPRAVLRTTNGRYRGYAIELVDTRARSSLYGWIVTTCTVWRDPPVEDCTFQAPDAQVPVQLYPGTGR
jgi:hypothetical protein